MSILYTKLKDSDPEIHSLIDAERKRQHDGLEMIASENFTSTAVFECLGSCLTNKYSEGRPGQRYYGGNEYIDQIEHICQARALKAFRLDDTIWGVNVQPYSGSPANFAVYTALLMPHDRIMGLHLPDGGHLTHGFQTPNNKISATSLFWESSPYYINPETELIDYERLAESVLQFKPKLLIAGFSCYSRRLDYAKFREIADTVGAILMADMAHVAGLVASDVYPSPFEYCDVVTTTTHKTLRGPRSGIIFYRKRIKNWKNGEGDVEKRINWGVFPALQGGPHNNVIAAVATALKQVNSEEFKNYSRQVVENAQEFATAIQELGYKIVSGGTDNHIVVINLQGTGLNGAFAESILDYVGISVNKNTCAGDKSVLKPSGIRVGTPALTSRGFGVYEMHEIAKLFDQVFKFGSELLTIHGDQSRLIDLRSIEQVLANSSCRNLSLKLHEVRSQVEQLASKFKLPSDLTFE